ncbi:Cytosol aminopeptidase [Candidatus Kinetoplastibacterium sorsogonicusi]|uniref:Probable cytosol aminopeptidase n=1 Tax=Candidatus Kinetoplastidibacterium kentomonadis TaxID=1576550 RepID=A0A3Q8ERQ0_9PROT|nr:leucyl aminopeptidase [Candidatus Kinetoplastibacterium sorsogonicusi]AWD32547.1 Cytosol aminopeptidase [Candidatus Kinetoplastibacterium sorsogonicusi]
MKFSIKSINMSIDNLSTEVLVIGVFSDKTFNEKINNLIKNFSDHLISTINTDFNPKLGNILTLHLISELKSQKIMLIGLGDKNKYSHKAHKKVIQSLISNCLSNNIKNIISTLILNHQTNKKLTAKIDVISIGYNLYKYDSKKCNNKYYIDSEFNVSYLVDPIDIEEINIGSKEGLAIVNGMNLSRLLGDLPSNICTPTYIGKLASKLTKDFPTINTKLFEKREIELLNMQSFLSVSKGSLEPPRLILMNYNCDKNNNTKPIVLVGKGVTFDSGGISIKPSNSMDEMKYDMCGAATIIGVFRALAELKLNINVIGIIVACENMPSGSANKPGDVITSMSGKTIEIINTDAEGRLILCDALTYAKQFDPSTIIDIATLTGACVVSLGNVHSGLFSNNINLTKELITAGKEILDPVWELPLDEDYNECIKSNYADLANSSGPYAGAITAASFLSNFIEIDNWAHIDIAGTAWEKNKNRGSTGRPVSLIMQYLLNKL